MNCSVCNRNNAVTLSICPSCGAMINDSVRQELVPKVSLAAKVSAPKVSYVSQRLNFDLTENKMIPKKTTESASKVPAQVPDGAIQTATMEIAIKPTNPTLIEFRNKNNVIPEWRLQLQNVVRQRQGREMTETEVKILPTAPSAPIATSGANALKAEINQPPQTVQPKNRTLNNALERIEKSRQQFLEAESPAVTSVAAPSKANKNYPFHIAGKTTDANFKAAESNLPVNYFAKPKLAASLEPGHIKLDTNKLPMIPESASLESLPAIVEDLEAPVNKTIKPKIEIVETAAAQNKSLAATPTVEAEEIEEFDDCAPFAMRFNAGLFDLIIGSFVSLLLLAPFMLFGGNWFSIHGLFAFLATCAIVMFVYMTTIIGFYGRTFGMRLFSLEIVDVENESYPTFHQAAVSSAVYLLSLALGGIGFLTLPFNEDRRAVHDLVSGTIIIREE